MSRRPTRYAVRYGTAPGCPVSFLGQGAEKDGRSTSRSLSGSLKALQAGGRSWSMPGSTGRGCERAGGCITNRHWTRTGRSGAWIRLKTSPTLMVTHMHCDHADKADLFRGATVWIQKEMSSIITRARAAAVRAKARRPSWMTRLGPGEAEHRGPCSSGRGRRHEIIPCATVYTGGKHTRSRRIVGVNT